MALDRDAAQSVESQPLSRAHVGKVSEVPRSNPYTVAHGRIRGATFKPMAYVAGCTCGWHGQPRALVREAREDRDAHLEAQR